MINTLKGLFLSLCLLIAFSATAQTVEGLVKSEDTDLPIQYAMITIIDADSLIVGGAVTDTLGYFMIDELIEGTYTMSVSYMGYITKHFEIEMDDNHFDFDPLYLVREEEILPPVVKSKAKKK